MENNAILQLILDKLDKLEQDVSGLKQDVNKINIKLENTIEPNLKLVLENQTQIGADHKVLNVLKSNVNNNTDSISVLSMAVKEHSKDIQLLKAN